MSGRHLDVPGVVGDPIEGAAEKDQAAGPIAGLVDIHAHGALGAEFGSSPEGSRRAAAHHAAEGTGRQIASLVSATFETLARQVRTLVPLILDGTLAGIHCEGPFLAQARRGAHDPTLLRDPDPSWVSRLAEVASAAGCPGAVLQWTFAPELDRAEPFVRALSRHGILPAIGHTDASAAQVERALGLVADITGREPLVTHLFNAMPPLHHRHGGPAAVALSSAARGEAVVELITDGTHVSSEVARMVFDSVGGGQIALVSDAMAATGLGDGDYLLGPLNVTVLGGTARLREGGEMSERGAIAGSTATLAQCVRWAINVAGIDRPEVMRAATTTPTRVLFARPSPPISRAPTR